MVRQRAFPRADGVSGVSARTYIWVASTVYLIAHGSFTAAITAVCAVAVLLLLAATFGLSQRSSDGSARKAGTGRRLGTLTDATDPPGDGL